MITIKQTTSEDLDFIKLVKELDQNLALKNGNKNDFFIQFNKIDYINHVVIAYENEIAIGCGAFKNYNDFTIEIKRMYVSRQHRNKGIASKILNKLLDWGSELNYTEAVLETGEMMTEAISLYLKYGFKLIENYTPYENELTSKCFKKKLSN